MEPYLIIVLVVAAFLAGRFFPTQDFTKKITDVARENAFRETKVRMHRAAELCGTYTCLSSRYRRIQTYPRAVSLQIVVLESESGTYLKISCDEQEKLLTQGQKVRVRLRNPGDPPVRYSEGYGDLLEVVPVEAS